MPAPRLVALASLLAIALASPASADVSINIDKSTQMMAVDVDGERLYDFPVSTGKAGHETPAGPYRPFRKERTHFSKEWDDAPMPFSLFFTAKGHAIHGSASVPRGRAASHGCVRLSVRNAETLFDLVEKQGLNKTRIAISGIEPVPAPAVATRRSRVEPRPVRYRERLDYNGESVFDDGYEIERAPVVTRRRPAYVPYDAYEDRRGGAFNDYYGY